MPLDPVRIRIILVEQNDTTRDLMQKLLEFEPDIEVVADAAGWRAGFALCQKLTPDVVATGLLFPHPPDGYSATRAIRLLRPAPRVIVATVVEASQGGTKARDVGASAYLAKPFSGNQLVAAIREVATAPSGHWYEGPWIEEPL